MSSFGDRLKQYVGRDTPVSQAELARQTGLSPPSISEWLADNVKVDNIKALPLLKAAAFLRVNPMWLLTGRGTASADSATVTYAAEPSVDLGVWPFDRVSPDAYARLPEHVKIGIAQLLDGAILGAGVAAPPTVTRLGLVPDERPFSDRLSRDGQTGRDAVIRERIDRKPS